MPRSPERIVAAAITSGRIPRSRARHYLDLAGRGVDLAFMDTLAAVPDLDPAVRASQDDEDQVYLSLFNDGSRSDRVAASGAPVPEGDAYKTIFPTAEEAQAALDDLNAAKAAAVASLTDDELWETLGMNRKRGK